VGRHSLVGVIAPRLNLLPRIFVKRGHKAHRQDDKHDSEWQRRYHDEGL
jgi:hypothetical protein